MMAPWLQRRGLKCASFLSAAASLCKEHSSQQCTRLSLSPSPAAAPLRCSWHYSHLTVQTSKGSKGLDACT